MTTTMGAAYDLTTLERARGDSPLEVRQGLATSYHWVAPIWRSPPTAAPFAP